MSDFPGITLAGSLPRGVISSIDGASPAGEYTRAVRATGASAVWPSANLAIYVHFQVEVPCVAYRMFAYNGATVAGNFDLGIYRDTTRLVSIGSTAQSGASLLQEVDITDTTLLPCVDYYMSLARDSATATNFRVSPTLQGLRVCYVWQQATAFPLPSTATLANLTSAYLPVFGINVRAVTL